MKRGKKIFDKGIFKPTKKKAIIAISGGIDSAVATAIAKSEGYELYFLTVNYGQKNLKKELKNSLSDEEYTLISDRENYDIKFKFKILEFFGNSKLLEAKNKSGH